MAKSYIIGIDLGATKINTILMNRKGKILKKIKVKTLKNREKGIEQILENIEGVRQDKKIIGIGIGIPGILNEKRNKILKLPNLPEWENIDLKRIIEKETKNKVKIENDANCMALGESMFGQGKNVKNLVCLTIGTGIGGGIIINNKIYSGKGNAGEFGHITIDIDGYKCGCGSRGCLEKYVLKRKINTKYLGIGLSNIVKIIDPELIVIGGGFSNLGGAILKPAIKEMEKRTFLKTCPVKIVKLGDNAGAIGAACLFLI